MDIIINNNLIIKTCPHFLGILFAFSFPHYKYPLSFGFSVFATLDVSVFIGISCSKNQNIAKTAIPSAGFSLLFLIYYNVFNILCTVYALR